MLILKNKKCCWLILGHFSCKNMLFFKIIVHYCPIFSSGRSWTPPSSTSLPRWAAAPTLWLAARRRSPRRTTTGLTIQCQCSLTSGRQLWLIFLWFYCRLLTFPLHSTFLWSKPAANYWPPSSRQYSIGHWTKVRMVRCIFIISKLTLTIFLIVPGSSNCLLVWTASIPENVWLVVWLRVVPQIVSIQYK